MSSQTAAKWFRPDDEYYLANEDYVFCVQGSAETKSWLRSLEDRDGPLPDGIDTLYIDTLYTYMKHWGPWFVNKDGSGRLIYADAKERDITERVNFIRARAKIPLLEKLPEELLVVDKRLIEWVKKKIPKELLQEESEALDRRAESYARRKLGEKTELGFIPGDLIDYIISQNDPRERTDLLTLLSRQGYTKTPRPTMLLIAAVSDIFAAPGPQQKGFVTVYDVTKEVFVTKSYGFDRDQYVLAESWFSKDSEDGFYACDTPKSFISALKAPKSIPTADNNALLKLFTQSLVCKWLITQQEAFMLSEEDVSGLQKHVADAKKCLESQKLPALEQPESAKKSEVLIDLSSMLEDLTLAEGNLRDMAVRAKEDGLETTANNLAKHFEKMIRDLTQMVEHPELPLQD